MAKFDLKSEATRGLYAGAGVADLAVVAVKEYVSATTRRIEDVQKGVQSTVSKLAPSALRDQAVTVVSTRVEAISEDAKARRAAVEARVAELQELPTTVQTRVNENLVNANETYVDLAKHGAAVVAKLRNSSEYKETVKDAKTATAKAKTTATQARKTGTTAKKAAEKAQRDVKKTTTTARKTVAKKAAPAKSSAKATTTTAKKTVAAAAKTAEKAVDTAGETSTKPTSTTTSSSTSTNK